RRSAREGQLAGRLLPGMGPVAHVSVLVLGAGRELAGSSGARGMDFVSADLTRKCERLVQDLECVACEAAAGGAAVRRRCDILRRRCDDMELRVFVWQAGQAGVQALDKVAKVLGDGACSVDVASCMVSVLRDLLTILPKGTPAVLQLDPTREAEVLRPGADAILRHGQLVQVVLDWAGRATSWTKSNHAFAQAKLFATVSSQSVELLTLLCKAASKSSSRQQLLGRVKPCSQRGLEGLAATAPAKDPSLERLAFRFTELALMALEESWDNTLEASVVSAMATMTATPAVSCSQLRGVSRCLSAWTESATFRATPALQHQVQGLVAVLLDRTAAQPNASVDVQNLLCAMTRASGKAKELAELFESSGTIRLSTRYEYCVAHMKTVALAQNEEDSIVAAAPQVCTVLTAASMSIIISMGAEPSGTVYKLGARTMESALMFMRFFDSKLAVSARISRSQRKIELFGSGSCSSRSLTAAPTSEALAVLTITSRGRQLSRGSGSARNHSLMSAAMHTDHEHRGDACGVALDCNAGHRPKWDPELLVNDLGLPVPLRWQTFEPDGVCVKCGVVVVLDVHGSRDVVAVQRLSHLVAALAAHHAPPQRLVSRFFHAVAQSQELLLVVFDIGVLLSRRGTPIEPFIRANTYVPPLKPTLLVLWRQPSGLRVAVSGATRGEADQVDRQVRAVARVPAPPTRKQFLWQGVGACVLRLTLASAFACAPNALKIGKRSMLAPVDGFLSANKVRIEKFSESEEFGGAASRQTRKGKDGERTLQRVQEQLESVGIKGNDLVKSKFEDDRLTDFLELVEKLTSALEALIESATVFHKGICVVQESGKVLRQGMKEYQGGPLQGDIAGLEATYDEQLLRAELQNNVTKPVRHKIRELNDIKNRIKEVAILRLEANAKREQVDRLRAKNATAIQVGKAEDLFAEKQITYEQALLRLMDEFAMLKRDHESILAKAVASFKMCQYRFVMVANANLAANCSEDEDTSMQSSVLPPDGGHSPRPGPKGGSPAPAPEAKASDEIKAASGLEHLEEEAAELVELTDKLARGDAEEEIETFKAKDMAQDEASPTEQTAPDDDSLVEI
ncbi:Uncharacterized protein SCF082_LOCUS7080, partial [Durusdinium trenchii]